MQIKSIFPLLICVLAIITIQEFDSFLFNTFFYWVLSLLIYFSVFKYCRVQLKKNIIKFNGWDYLLLIYIIWVIICTIRGFVIADNYWEVKSNISDMLSLLLPSLIFILYNPDIDYSIIKYWTKWIFPIIVFFYIFDRAPNIYYTKYLSPFFILGCFIPALPKKWRLIYLLFLLLMSLTNLGSRSLVIKSIFCIFLSIVFLYRKFIDVNIFKILHGILFCIPLIFLTLGLLGIFNVFDMEQFVGEKEYVDRSGETESLTSDTRTFIYQEVITSAIQNNYILLGRTPARGNDTQVFYDLADNLKSKSGENNIKRERTSNEVCMANVFTWCGLIGLILYCSIYFISSYKSIYHSKNIYIKIIGIYVAFRWMYGWVEDINRLDMANVVLWMMVAMCYSPLFRNMTDIEFKKWINSIFKFKY